MTRIALDAMGGDFAPEVPVAGAVEALHELPSSCELILVGRATDIESVLEKQTAPRDRLSIVDAPETVRMGEKPLASVRGKRKSSIRVGLELQKRGEADAFISAGNTGAVMAASTLLLGLHSGIRRPAIATVLPGVARPVLLLDAGANVDCSARELRGFAHIGSVYARDVMGRDRPNVGLLNIGEEEEKGSQVVREAFELLTEDSGINFAGNVEGRDVLHGDCDVVVCDGFVGNVLLKFGESAGRAFTEMLRKELDPEVMVSPGMRRVLGVLDYSETGGAPLLGVKGISVICHGRSSARAIKNAILVALRAAESKVSKDIGADLARGVA